MATINLGRIKPVWKNTWTATTAYVVDDIVRSGVTSYICINAHTSGASFAVGSDWNVMSQGSNIGTGTAGQVLKTDSAGTGIEWGADEGGKVLQVVATDTNTQTSPAQSTWTDVAGGAVTITPSATTSRIHLSFMCGSYAGDYAGNLYTVIRRNGVDIHEGMPGKRNNANEESVSINIILVDSPTTTAAVTYQLRVYRQGTGPWVVNSTSTSKGLNSIAMEIGA